MNYHTVFGDHAFLSTELFAENMDTRYKDWYISKKFRLRNDWPDHLKHLKEPHQAGLYLLVAPGWEFCPCCFSIQPRFTHGISHEKWCETVGNVVCNNCVSTFKYQTTYTIREWLVNWYKRRALELSREQVDQRYFPLGIGDSELQFDTFDFMQQGNYITHAFTNRCAYCGSSLNKAGKGEKCSQFDHVIARDKGGHSVVENIALACHSCNASKRTKSATEYFAYRRSRNLTVATDLEPIVTEIEANYLSMFKQFTNDDIIAIKSPITKLFPLPTVGESYFYTGQDKRNIVTSPPYMSNVIVTHMGSGRRAYACKVRQCNSKETFIISCGLLRKT